MPANTYDLASGTDNVTTNLQANSYVIGDAIYAKTLNTSFWNALTPKTPLPTGVGDKLVSLVYDPSLPTTTIGGTTVGVNWVPVGQDFTSATTLNTSIAGQVNTGVAGSAAGTKDGLSYVKWTKKMLDYSLFTTKVQSPWLDVNDFRTAAGIAKQSAALMKALTGSVRWAWERRHQVEFEKVAGNLVCCKLTSTAITTTVDGGSGTVTDSFYGENLTGSGLDIDTTTNLVPDGYISNAITDKIYNRLRIVTSPDEAWGNDNGLPVFALVIGTDASLALKRDGTGIREDMRRSSMVDNLLKPLGFNESFRGFYHMTLPDPPRFTIAAGVLTRVEPLDASGIYNPAYDAATIEAAYVVHKEVLECQVPTPTVLAPGATFNPVNYMGDWSFVNNKDNVANIIGDKGYYFGVLASATKPKNHEYGYVILFLRSAALGA